MFLDMTLQTISLVTKISHRSTIGVAFRQEDGTVVKKSFKVKGILQNSKPTVVSEDSDYDLTVFIPISTMNEMTGKKDYGAFLAMANSPGKVREIAGEVDSRLARNFGIPEKKLKMKILSPILSSIRQMFSNRLGNWGML